MDIKEKYMEDTKTWHVLIIGEVDVYNAPELKKKFHDLAEQHRGDFVLDCADLTYIDSTGLGVLISLLKKVKEYDGSIEINNLKPFIHKIFVITGLDKIFTIGVQEA
ncbi:MAG: STAS domain-containing protein [Clostridiales bacterium]|nr:STAS domain-containing protein [Clostridiales bacterium]